MMIFTLAVPTHKAEAKHLFAQEQGEVRTFETLVELAKLCREAGMQAEFVRRDSNQDTVYSLEDIEVCAKRGIWPFPQESE